MLTGEVGTGKTTICRTWLSRLDYSTKTAFILNPNFSELQLLQLINKDFGLAHKSNNKLDLVEAFNQFLIEESNRGNNVVIIIDEAQNLNARQLEQIRLLSNLETEKQKLLQIVLVGQPELLDKLKLPQLRQLNQRIAVRYHILPLSKQEVKQYILHRLQVAQADQELQFSEKSFDTIFIFTHGSPRLINILCDRALLAGFAKGTRTINEDLINQCAREVQQVL